MKQLYLLGALLAGATAQALELDGAVGVEARGFWNRAQFENQDDDRFAPSLILAPTLEHEWAGGRQRLTFAPYARLDARDEERSHADLREANWLVVGDGWDVRAGVAQVFWGVAESRHLVNVINQVDGVEDIDGEDFLGQPLVNLNLLRGQHRLGLYAMSGFRERTFPGDHARLRGPLAIAEDDPVFEADSGRGHVDLAARYSVSAGPLDLGIAHFSGTSREPRLVPRVAGPLLPPPPRLELRPYYDLIDQTSVDAQLTTGAWAWKLEGITRSGHGERFEAAVAGFEYTLYEALGTAADIGILAEYLYDNRPAGAPPTTMEDDLFAGLRWTGNDLADTNILLGVIHDLDDESLAFSLEGRRRIGARLSLELEVRTFQRVPDADLLAAIRADDFAQLRVLYWF